VLDKFVDNLIDIFYSKDRTKLYIAILFIVGVILRIIAANNGGLSADDAGHALRAVGSIESGKLEEYGQSSILWYYIQECFMKVFGDSQLGSRMATVLFGSCFIVLIFLFVKQVFKSNKAGLIASTLAAFSPWFIKMTLPEMDIAATFFILFSALFVFKFIEDYKNRNLIFASILMGLAIMIKVYSLFFALSFFIFMLIYLSRKKDWKFGLKKVIIFSLILLIFCIPTLTYNYLLYKDKGFIDYMATNVLKVGMDKSAQFYSWAPGWNTPSDFSGFLFGMQKTYLGNGQSITTNALPGFVVLLRDFFINEPLIMMFGFLGLIFLFVNKEKKFPVFFLLSAAIPFVYLGAHIPMIKHQTYMPVLLIAPAAFFISFLHDQLIKKVPKLRLRYILIIIIIFNLFWLGVGKPITAWDSIYSTGTETKLINYKISNIEPDSFVIVDGRIFRGIDYWMFNDRNFIESGIFNQALQEANKYGNLVDMNVYFVECAIDDCGWGTIKDQPEFNKSTEDLLAFFANSSEVTVEISGPGYQDGFYIPFLSKPENITRFRVYKTVAKLPASILPIAKSTHNYLLYPIGYDRSFGALFDDYKTYNPMDSLLNNFGRYLLYLGIVLSILSCLFLLYIFVIEEKTKESLPSEVNNI